MPNTRAGNKDNQHEDQLLPFCNANPSSNQNILDAISSLKEDINSIKQDICTTIDVRISEMSTALRTEFTAHQAETQSALASLQATMDAQGATVKDLETKATHTAELTTHFDKEIKRLSTLFKSLEDECDSLEGHLCRNTLRIIGLPEGQEGQWPRDFVSELLKDMMDLDSKPLRD
ncbi:hypothetical protein ABVT39_016784 [Epinephelus coioides]